jgi:hypothetical protein
MKFPGPFSEPLLRREHPTGRRPTMNRSRTLLILLLASVALTACAQTGSGQGFGTIIGAGNGGATVAGGVVGADIGGALDDADRRAVPAPAE